MADLGSNSVALSHLIMNLIIIKPNLVGGSTMREQLEYRIAQQKRFVTKGILYSIFQIKLRFLDSQVNGRVQLDCMASGRAGTSNTKDGCM